MSIISMQNITESPNKNQLYMSKNSTNFSFRLVEEYNKNYLMKIIYLFLSKIL